MCISPLPQSCTSIESPTKEIFLQRLLHRWWWSSNDRQRSYRWRVYDGSRWCTDSANDSTCVQSRHDTVLTELLTHHTHYGSTTSNQGRTSSTAKLRLDVRYVCMVDFFLSECRQLFFGGELFVFKNAWLKGVSFTPAICLEQFMLISSFNTTWTSENCISPQAIKIRLGWHKLCSAHLIARTVSAFLNSTKWHLRRSRRTLKMERRPTKLQIYTRSGHPAVSSQRFYGSGDQ
jgi:hypothetical protein